MVNLFTSLPRRMPLNSSFLQASLDNFVKRIKGSPDAYAQITDWGLKLADTTVIVQSRALEPETIMFGKGYRY